MWSLALRVFGVGGSYVMHLMFFKKSRYVFAARNRYPEAQRRTVPENQGPGDPGRVVQRWVTAPFNNMI